MFVGDLNHLFANLAKLRKVSPFLCLAFHRRELNGPRLGSGRPCCRRAGRR